MSTIVQKYGGTSMGSTDRIKNVARRVAKWHRAGHRMVVVVSAMSGETNRLIALAKEIMPNPDPRELDVIASTGEQVSIGLLAMALKAIGVEAVSYNGTQVGVHTDSAYTKARIESIDAGPIQSALDAGKVVIVAGFRVKTPKETSQPSVAADRIPRPWRLPSHCMPTSASFTPMWTAFIQRTHALSRRHDVCVF